MTPRVRKRAGVPMGQPEGIAPLGLTGRQVNPPVDPARLPWVPTRALPLYLTKLHYNHLRQRQVGR